MNYIPNTDPVMVTISDVLGRVAYSENVVFVNGKVAIAPKNLNSGPFVLRISDNTGKINTFKFSVQN